MSTIRTEPSVPEQAARWVVQLEDESASAVLGEFTAWLKASPRHVEEFLFAKAAWERFNGLNGARELDVRRMLAETIDNIAAIPAEYTSRNDSAARPVMGARKRWLAWAAGLAAAVCAAAGWMTTQFMSSPEYATEIGEQRNIKLSDGSLVQLNTGTRIEAHLTDTVREVRLVDGEACFTVARDTTRPFRVQSGGVTVQAIGTQFNVYRHMNTATVSVIEGTVRVRAGRDDRMLNAGEEATVTPNEGIIQRHAADIEKSVAWRERRLVFRDNTLADIVAEFNRYNEGYQIKVAGAAASNLRLTGVFRADDPEAIVLYLAQNTDLVIDRPKPGTVMIRDH